MKWTSKYNVLGEIEFPMAQGVRILMMPFKAEDVAGTLPYNQWKLAVQKLVSVSGQITGTCYLTIEETLVDPRRSQRRPGLHVDGWHDDGAADGIWGGGGSGGIWGGRDCEGPYGMLMASSMYGCNVYSQEFDGEPAEYGDCEHLRSQLISGRQVECQPGQIYACGPMTVHESVKPREYGPRQFVRLSMPSDGMWPESCTPNPLGVFPDGPIAPARPEEFTRYAREL